MLVKSGNPAIQNATNATDAAKLKAVTLVLLLGLAMNVHETSGNATSVMTAQAPNQESRSPRTAMWVSSVISAADNKEPALKSYWIGIRNIDAVPRIACIGIGSWDVYIDSKTEAIGGMLWGMGSHMCDPDSHLRRLVLPGETFYQYAVVNMSKAPHKPKALFRVFLTVYDLGTLEEGVYLEGAAKIDLESSIQIDLDRTNERPDSPDSRTRESDTEALQSGTGEQDVSKSGTSDARGGTWSLSVLPPREKRLLGGTWRYWVGVKNNSSEAQVILWPIMNHELGSDGDVDRSDEASEITGFPRPFFVLPGQTFFRTKVIDARNVSGAGPAELLLRVSVTEATLMQSTAVAQKHIDLEWRETLQVSK